MNPNYVSVTWQDGPVKENGINGAQVDDVLAVVIEKMQELNTGEFRCRENSLAITALEEAQNWLWRRTRLREDQGVEGTNLRHQSYAP